MELPIFTKNFVFKEPFYIFRAIYFTFFEQLKKELQNQFLLKKQNQFHLITFIQ